MLVADASPTNSIIQEGITAMSIYHNHHIVPRHMNGTDVPSNIERITIEEHAERHKALYEKHGKEQDRIAWLSLTSQISQAEAIKLIQKAPKSERWKTKARERNKGSGNPMFGKKQTQEHRRKNSESNIGIKNHFYGKQHSIETRAILSQKMKNRYLQGYKNPMKSIESRQKLSKNKTGIYSITFSDGLETITTLKELSIKLGISLSCITKIRKLNNEHLLITYGIQSIYRQNKTP
jgi:hypothetical protein